MMVRDGVRMRKPVVQHELLDHTDEVRHGLKAAPASALDRRSLGRRSGS